MKTGRRILTSMLLIVLAACGTPERAGINVAEQSAAPAASPAPVASCAEVGNAYRDQLSPLIALWSDTVSVAQQAAPTQLDPHITHLTNLYRTLTTLSVPDCWQTAHTHLTAMAESTIQALRDRQANAAADVINASIRRANEQRAAFAAEEVRILGVPSAPVAVGETPAPVPTQVAAPTPIPPTATPEPVQASGQVVEVVDGDTIKVMLDGVVETIRLIGIDTPETKHPSKPVECFGHEAAAKAQELLAGQTVSLEVDPSQGERDTYGRLLRYIWLPDSRMANQELIAQGFAYEYTYELPYTYQAEFKQAQQQADASDLGLWAAATCNGTRVAVEPTAPPAVEVPPTAEAPPAQAACDPSYPDFCLEPGLPDLDCADISFQVFTVLPPDPHGFDGNDNDGIGCEGESAPAPAEPAPVQPVPVEPAPAEPPPAAACDPAYPDFCLEPGIADLDCGDIAWRHFTVLPPDPHGFDGNDNDGIGCES